MKRLNLILFVFFVTIFSQVSFGSNNPMKKSELNRELIIKNLMIGIKSDNYGLRTSSALMLGEFRADESVIDLLRMLHSEDTDDARIVAALSLLKIEDSRGIYAIKQAIRFDKSERVKKLCEKFYNHYLESLKK
ncbi:HEAT repeat domain-containing protein [Ignavibacterium sp.]|uniref:HEAT repeat domain-containing protein n=1 Tax=Ignavibacterium sp. TaxID=2651167 RepID=UPI00307E7492